MDNKLSKEYDELERIYEGTVEPGNLSLELLKHMTDHFSEDRKIAAGGFGDVYMGFFRNRSVAVKKITTNAHTLDEQPFRREVMSLMKVKHQNVVQFLGFCSHTVGNIIKQEGSEERVFVQMRERLLCFKYASGNLEKHINDELKGLEWDQRYKIIQGICEGLQHIHKEVKIIHMDLKPANILIDDHMIPKITDFGLAREDTNTHTTGLRFGSRGYFAPEYQQHGEMSQKSDIYSLGVIIIELVTGRLCIPNKDNVLRKWSHRWNRTQKYTLLRYQQVTKCMEIAVRCMKEDPKDRPFIWDIIHDLCENESTNDANESTVEKISPNYQEDMLLIEPLELHFPFEINKQISQSVQLTNNTDTNIAFNIETPQHFWIQPNKGIVPQRFNCSVTVTLQPQEKALQYMKSDDEFTVESTKVKEGHLRPENITKEMFNKEGVDKVDMSILYESKINSSTSKELIKVDPLELHFPFLPNMRVTCLMKLVNITPHYVGFNIFGVQSNIAKYNSTPEVGILPPWSTHQIVVSRITKEGAVEDIQCKDKYFVWRNIVDKNFKANDLAKCFYREYCLEIPVVLDKISSSCTSNELIKVDPPELRFPFLPSTSVGCSVKLVNITPCYVGFNIWTQKGNSATHRSTPSAGILPPESTQQIVVSRRAKEGVVQDDIQCKDKFFVWRTIVDKSVKASDLGKCFAMQHSMEIPILLDKMPISSFASNEPIQLEPPELRFAFLPNMSATCSVELLNISPYHIAFSTWVKTTNVALYNTTPKTGMLSPGSKKKLVVSRSGINGKVQDIQCNDKFFLWRNIVNENFDTSIDLSGCFGEEYSIKLPIVLVEETISSSTSKELIKVDPPELHFPFLPKMSTTCLVKLVNITPRYVGFNILSGTETNIAKYCSTPGVGILSPWSTQQIVVSRIAKEGAVEEIQCKDKYFVWRNIVDKSFKTSDLAQCISRAYCTEIPVVLDKVLISSSCTSNELIKVDPPELRFPFLPSSTSVACSVKLVNITPHYVGFSIWTSRENSATHYVTPCAEILPPGSTKQIVVCRIGREGVVYDIQCKDKLFVWRTIVDTTVKVSDLSGKYLGKQHSMEIPLLLEKMPISSFASNEPIQLDPPELRFAFLPNISQARWVELINISPYHVIFHVWFSSTSVALYTINPSVGMLAPGSRQKLVVSRREKKGAVQDIHCKDNLFVWRNIVNENFSTGINLSRCSANACSIKLPIVLTEATEE